MRWDFNTAHIGAQLIAYDGGARPLSNMVKETMGRRIQLREPRFVETREVSTNMPKASDVGIDGH